MARLHSLRLACSVALLLGLLATAGHAEAPMPRLVLVLDGSGSMYGQLDGEPKIRVARQVVRELLGDWNPKVEIGLTAYGHRRKDDCDDIEALVEPGPADVKRILEAVDSLRPRGRTPLSKAVENAAHQLEHHERSATVILISDGKETCGVDPCEMARRLEESGVDFTAHVIGFDITPEERGQLACLADETGGLFLTADGMEGLRDALATAVAEASRTPGEPRVWLAAALAEERAPLREEMDWTIYRLKPDGAPEAEPTVEEHAETLLLALADGRYRVRARHLGVAGERDIVVRGGRSSHHIVGLGAARVEAIGVDAPEDLEWKIRKGGATGSIIAKATGRSHGFVLAPGRYLLEADTDGSRVTRQLMLEEGQTLEKRVDFGGGSVVLSAALSEDLPPLSAPIHWEVTNSEGRLLSKRDGANALINLPKGTYRVKASYGETDTYWDIDVLPGKTQSMKLALDAAEVKVFGVLPPPGGPVHDPIDWQVESLSGSHPGAKLTTPSHTFVLPAGRYRVSGQLSGKTGDREVELSPGESTSLSITLKSGSPASR